MLKNNDDVQNLPKHNSSASLVTIQSIKDLFELVTTISSKYMSL